MLRSVSITRTTAQYLDDLYVVTADARTADGRTDSGTGAVCIKGLAGEAKANAIMKAETKAKRRVTLSICGLGMTDESEVGSIDEAEPVNVNVETGEIVGEAKPIEPPQRKSNGHGAAKPARAGDDIDAAMGDSLTVAKVETLTYPKKGKDGQPTGETGTFYAVIFSDDKQATTFDSKIAEVAEKFRAARVPVEPVIEAGKKEGTWKLVELSRAQGAGDGQ